MKLKNYILASTHLLLCAALFVGCIDEIPEQSEREVSFCVRTAWQDGLRSSTTRALSYLTDTEGGKDIVIDPEVYPDTINVHCSDGKDFTLTKGLGPCATHTNEKYWNYDPSIIYKIRQIENENLTFTATATIDTVPGLGDELKGEATKDKLQDSHLRITLHHTKALLRFAFRVSEKYDSIRYVKITEIQLNGIQCHLAGPVVLSSDNYQVIAYAYIDPKVVTTSIENTIKCTYNIYDKDEATEDHLTRKGVVAQNQFTLGSIKDKSNNLVTEILAGYYYDLKVTLNPNYLYVLAEHDNKHMTIE